MTTNQTESESTSLLHGLTEQDKQILFRNGKKKTLSKDRVIMRQGTRSDTGYVINSGRVKVFLSDEHGREIVLAFLEAGDYFGEMSLLDEEDCSASVVTEEDTELVAISRADFRACLHANPELTERLLLGLIGRLRDANKKISSLALTDVHSRVVGVLRDLAEERDGRLVIEDRPTHQHIANLVGSSREMITRILKSLADDGQIEISGKTLVILDRSLK